MSPEHGSVQCSWDCSIFTPIQNLPLSVDYSQCFLLSIFSSALLLF